MKKKIIRQIWKKGLPVILAVLLAVNATMPVVMAENAGSQGNTASVENQNKNITEKTATDVSANAVSADAAVQEDAVQDAVSGNEAGNVEAGSGLAAMLGAMLFGVPDTTSDSNANIQINVDATYGEGTVSYQKADSAAGSSYCAAQTAGVCGSPNHSDQAWIKYTTVASNPAKGTVSLTVTPAKRYRVASLKWNDDALDLEQSSKAADAPTAVKNADGSYTVTGVVDLTTTDVEVPATGADDTKGERCQGVNRYRYVEHLHI